MRVTIKDIAQACGVGVATVSRAVNGSGYVRKEIKDNILRHIENVGWKASNAALHLKTGKSHTVTILVNDILHHYNAMVVNDLSRELRHRGYQVTLSVGQCYQALEECRQRQDSEGVIVVGMTDELVPKLEEAWSQGFKIVVVGDSWNYSGIMIYPDHFHSCYDAVGRLAAAGQRKIAFFGMFGSKSHLRTIDDCHYFALHNMIKGLVRGAEESGIEFDMAADTVGDFYGDLRHLYKKLQEGRHTAYICQSIELTTHLYVACRELGVSIPGDVSMIGFGSINALRAFSPQPEILTYNVEEVIRKTMEVFFIPREELNQTVFTIPMIPVPGASVAAPPESNQRQTQ